MTDPAVTAEAGASAVAEAHARSGDDVAAALRVDPETGLSSGEVERRRSRYGPNRLGEQRSTPWWELLWRQLANAVVLLLVGAAVAGFLVGETVEALAIVVVLVVNTIVGFVTEFQAARSMAALRGLVSTVADVERDDRRDEVDAAELVPGDVITIEAGEKVPADVRLLEAEDLAVEESALTGESQPAGKSTEPVDVDAPVAERSSMAFMGTTVAQGRGRGVVTATGTRTEVGQVAEMAGEAEQRQAPLQRGLERLSRRLAVTVVLGAVGLLGIGLLRGRDASEVIEVALALAIAVVPEGLPAVATLTLAVGMRRMAAGNALVRNLPAVETLGSTTVVCSDKTGTLTENRMDVVEVSLRDGASGQELWRSAVLCNDADIDVDGDPVGDPTEVALLEAAAEAGIDWHVEREREPRRREVPFDSDAKRMATVGGDTVHIKGAPEALLEDGRDGGLREAARRMANEALRTLAVARRPYPGDAASDDELFEDIEVLGVIGMHDPPRDTAVGAIEVLHRAGIRTIMITGDRPGTAIAIADHMGVASDRVIDGHRLGTMSDEELAEAVVDVRVFARVDPGHKLRIIDALQRGGHVVAVTGDGVNDAPALSRADVGVAMGSGTDVARDAADIVLLDDRFDTIETAVEEGRRIFTNIRRFGQFLFSWHVAEVTVVAATIVLGSPPPLTGLMILWNNLVIDVLPSFALALEPSRSDVMLDPPRDPSEPVIDRGVLRRIASQAGLVAGVGLAAYAAAGWWFATDTAGAQTATFVAMSIGQVLAVFNARSERGHGFHGALANRWLWAALAITAALEGAALAIPGLRSILGLTTLPPGLWAVAVVLGLIPLGLTQAWRIVRRW